MKHTFSNREAIKTGWRIFKANWKFVLGLGAVTTIIQMFVKAVQQGLVNDSAFLAFILGLAAALLSIIIGLGWSKISLLLIRSQTATWESFKTDPKLWLQAIKAGLWLIFYVFRNAIVAILPGAVLGIIGYSVHIEWLSALGIGLAAIGLLVVAVYMSVKYQFISYVVIDHPNINPRDIFKKSGDLTDGNWWKLLGFMLVTGLVILLGAVCLVVGLIAAIPTVMLAKTKVYEMLKSHHEIGSVSSNE